jgi:hypothetical protein
VENLLTMLDSDDPTAREAGAVAAAIYLVHDGMIGITGAKKIGMQRMHAALINGGTGRGQRLAQHLTAENPVMSWVATFATK